MYIFVQSQPVKSVENWLFKKINNQMMEWSSTVKISQKVLFSKIYGTQNVMQDHNAYVAYLYINNCIYVP